ncbi:MAG: ATP-sensitive inward rectifier potassium channel 10 [Alphaproteobacteria bacterium]|nr:ATP-sensitive inward rectifier potassium channel 10 [Alphaproteobacteria bacterium]
MRARMRARTREEDSVTLIGAEDSFWSDAYHRLLTLPIGAFFAVMGAAFLAVNAVFAGLYMLDPGGVANARPGHYADYFFFSVQTLGSVGYGTLEPRDFYANALASLEVFTGILNLGVAAGLLFARISRPTARIVFSRQAVITRFDGHPALILRAANRRRNRVLEAEVSLLLVHDTVTAEGERLRRFDELRPVRARSPLFFLTWQIMHVIDETSPLHGASAESLAARNAEILVSLRGLDETFVSTIHARITYPPDQIVWGRRLADILTDLPDGRRAVDMGRFHEID